MPRSLAFEPAPASVGHSLAKNARLVRLYPPGLGGHGNGPKGTATRRAPCWRNRPTAKWESELTRSPGRRGFLPAK